jgi:hypothetical protein
MDVKWVQVVVRWSGTGAAATDPKPEGHPSLPRNEAIVPAHQRYIYTFAHCLAYWHCLLQTNWTANVRGSDRTRRLSLTSPSYISDSRVR